MALPKTPPRSQPFASFQNVFTPDEEQYIIYLKEESSPELSWRRIHEQFQKRFPQSPRSKGGLQVHYSRKLQPNKRKHNRSGSGDSNSSTSGTNDSTAASEVKTATLSTESTSDKTITALTPDLTSDKSITTQSPDLTTDETTNNNTSTTSIAVNRPRRAAAKAISSYKLDNYVKPIDRKLAESSIPESAHLSQMAKSIKTQAHVPAKSAKTAKVIKPILKKMSSAGSSDKRDSTKPVANNKSIADSKPVAKSKTITVRSSGAKPVPATKSVSAIKSVAAGKTVSFQRSILDAEPSVIRKHIRALVYPEKPPIREGWVPATPEMFAGLENVPRIFLTPPKGRIVEFSTRSGSFRIRMARPDDYEDEDDEDKNADGASDESEDDSSSEEE